MMLFSFAFVRTAGRTKVFVLISGLLALCGCGTESRTNSHTSPSVEKIAPAERTRPANPPAATVSRSDAIVVGAGISGLSAALDLARGGAKVTVIDMSSVFGGHAVMSQGSLSLVGTPVQEAAGVRDSPELAERDIMTFGEDADPEWVRYYVTNSRREVYDWVSELGVRFE
ncbi:MAG TPA: FAD-dependent oxidoreductase, partial [Planctomycetaceae bacterium]|nr:FAD-dependent oxidoreductase [Planctomycetaceae bacterium]